MRAGPQAFFAPDIRQVTRPTSAGPIAIPALYRDGSMLGLVYRVEPGGARAVIGDWPLDPLLVGGKALVLLAAFEHRESTAGVYNEVALGIQVKRRNTSPSWSRMLGNLRTVDDTALLIVNLPVTTQNALVGGVELWGFPKYLADICTSFRADRVDVTLASEFVVSHRRGIGVALPGPPLIAFTVLGGRLLRTVVETGHRLRFGGARSVRLELRGDGPTARSIRTLRLDQLRPACAFRSDAVQMILPFGKDLGPVAADGAGAPAPTHA